MRRRTGVAAGILAAFACILSSPAVFADDTPYRGWLYAETEHFRFVYEPADGASAAELVSFAEDVYRNVTSYFDRYPDRVTVVLNGRTDDANGYFTLAPDRIVLYVASPSDSFSGSRTENWLEFVLTHEFTHYMHLTETRGFFGLLSLLGGEVLALDTRWFMPGWMMEGITTDRETAYTAGGRGRNELFEMLYKAPVVEGKLFSLGRAAYESDYPPSGRIYVAGYMLVNYLNRTYGDDTFAKIHREFVRFPFFGVGPAVKKVTGKSLRTVYFEMQLSYGERFSYAETIEEGDKVSPDVWGSYYNAVRSESGIYVYRSTFDRPPAIVRFDPETASEQVIVESPLFDHSSFSVDGEGKLIVFAATETDYTHPAKPEVISDLYLRDVREGRTTRITRGEHLFHPALSPDGTRLVAVRREGSYMTLVEVDPSNGTVKPLYAPEEAFMMNPVFSPDGKHLAFVMNLRGMQDIYILDSGGAPGKPYPLVTTDAAGDYAPGWKDGGTVLFSSDREGDMYLYEAGLPAGGSNAAGLTRVLRDPIGVLAGVPYRDGVLYTTYSTRGYVLKFTTATEAVPIQTAPEAVPADRDYAPVEGRPFLDAPKLYLHLPYPALLAYNTAEDTIGFSLGLGITLSGASFLEKNSYDVSFEYYPSLNQPYVYADWSLRAGRFGFFYDFSYDYTPDYLESEFDALTVNVASVSFDLVNRTDPWRSLFLQADAGLQNVTIVSSQSPFTLTDIIANGIARDSGWSLLSTAGLNFSWHPTEDVTRIDLLAPGIDASVTGYFPLYRNTGAFDGLRIVSYAEASVRPMAHTMLKAAVKASAQTSDTLGVISFPPRGFPDGVSVDGRSVTAAAVTALDVIRELRPVDLPLPLGFNLTRMNAGAHLEWEASYGPEGFTPGRYLYAGIDMMFLVGLLDATTLPVGIGVAARVNLADPGAFLDHPEFSPYFYLGLDGFAYLFKRQVRGASFFSRGS